MNELPSLRHFSFSLCLLSFRLSAFFSSFISSSHLTPSLPVCLSPPPPRISFCANKCLDNRYHSTRNLFLLDGTLKTLGEKKEIITHSIFCLLKSRRVRSSIFCVCVCVCENLALEQWPRLNTALWGGLQREDLGCLQGLLRVHPTGDRRVTSSLDGAPPQPHSEIRPQWTEPGSQPCCCLWIL